MTRLVRRIACALALLAPATVPSEAPAQKAAKPTGVVQLDIGGPGPGFVLKDWPEPDHPVAVPWEQIARDFDKVVFTGVPNALGDTPFRWTKVQAWNYPLGASGFGLDTYFVDNGKAGVRIPEGIVTIGALVGGTFAGNDYTRKAIPGNASPYNLVRMAKKYFASSSGADVFLNNIPSVGGGQFWYDIYPNVLACQLAGLYGDRSERGAAADEPSLGALCRRATDTWYAVTDGLRAGRPLPEFAYQAVQLVAGRVQDGANLPARSADKFVPLKPCGPKVWDPHIAVQADPRALCLGVVTPYTQYESEAAAGIGYLGFMALEQTADPKYRQLTDWTFGYLDSIRYNPTYEILMPYGAVAAARMNAEYATRYKVDQYLNWVFSESSVRFFWSMLAGSWGGDAIYGLVGEPTRTMVYAKQTKGAPVQGSAAAQNTIVTAVTLAPIARYQPQFARALGKYLGHVATNARLFYPDNVRFGDDTTLAYLAKANDPLLSSAMPFEALESFNPGHVANEPFGTGDALKSGTYKTNLAVYGGAMVGGMAALFHPTNEAGIYQIDLLATDLPRPEAFPTYLFYNPYQTSTCVRVDIGLATAADARITGPSVSLYDLVAKGPPAKGGCGDASIQLAPGQAAVIAVTPPDDPLDRIDDRLVTRNEKIVVDYAP